MRHEKEIVEAFKIHLDTKKNRQFIILSLLSDLIVIVFNVFDRLSLLDVILFLFPYSPRMYVRQDWTSQSKGNER